MSHSYHLVLKSEKNERIKDFSSATPFMPYARDDVVELDGKEIEIASSSRKCSVSKDRVCEVTILILKTEKPVATAMKIKGF